MKEPGARSPGLHGQPDSRREIGIPFAPSGVLTVSDGAQLYYRSWTPEEVKVRLLYLHGLGAHGGWVEDLAQSLLLHGVDTLAPDLRGHGRTVSESRDLPGPTRLRTDLNEFADRLLSLEPRVPVLVMGTSLGGCLAISLAAFHSQIRGAILIAPAFRPIYLGLGERARLLLALALGRQASARTPLGRGLPISNNQSRLESLRSDPDSADRLSARTHWNAQRLISRARRDLQRLHSPVLCLQGQLDPVTSPAANQRLFQGRPRTRFVALPGFRHDLALEIEVGRVAQLVVDWIEGTRIAEMQIDANEQP